MKTPLLILTAAAALLTGCHNPSPGAQAIMERLATHAIDRAITPGSGK